ncbi:hypothetical protein GCM10009738_04150 [Kitasatospora viridis]|uniref:Uncharacterized protein n=1 Tax=Kitasatospora viridis TaxID=281105 RepID=A0A561SG00_9ACTN|nr:hypothetical protein FHX73_15419 [Kitasatospora viridis]
MWTSRSKDFDLDGDDRGSVALQETLVEQDRVVVESRRSAQPDAAGAFAKSARTRWRRAPGRSS